VLRGLGRYLALYFADTLADAPAVAHFAGCDLARRSTGVQVFHLRQVDRVLQRQFAEGLQPCATTCHASWTEGIRSRTQRHIGAPGIHFAVK
jgi:hypothetical protein